jgi:hypothetical protein
MSHFNSTNSLCLEEQKEKFRILIKAQQIALEEGDFEEAELIEEKIKNLIIE